MNRRLSALASIPLLLAAARGLAQTPPTVTGVPLLGDEKVPFTNVTVATFTDPDGDPPSNYTATIDWGDGTTSAGTVSGIPGDGSMVTGSHTYADEGHYPVKTTVHDIAANADGVGNSFATILETDLVVTGGSIAPVQNVLFTGQVATFTDPGSPDAAAAFVATIDWGDLTAATIGTVTGGAGTFAVDGSHTYTSLGPFTTKILVSEFIPTERVVLSGLNETPPNASPGTGVGILTLDPSETMITADLSFSGLVGTATAAHIHGASFPGVAAGVIFPLSGVPAATSGAIPTQSFAITPAQVVQLKHGLFYFNVHSNVFPGGEIRAQILYGGLGTGAAGVTPVELLRFEVE